LCEARGYKFQAVDLRWGVRDEAAVNQQTVRICLDEIARCQNLSPKPNFIMLLGDRYGWCPPPTLVAAEDMNAMRPHLGAAATELSFWYRLDENAVPAEYVLQPRRDQHKVNEVWEPVERRLHEALVCAAKAAGVSAEKRQLHGASATELEIIEGALNVGNAREHVFAFVREITNCGDVERSLPSTASERNTLISEAKTAAELAGAAGEAKPVPPPALAALDLLDTAVAAGTENTGDRGRLVWDRQAWNAQQRLKALLADRLGEANIWRYEAGWKDGALDLASVIADLPVGATPPLPVPDPALRDMAGPRKEWEQLSRAIAAEAHVALPDTRNLCEAVWQRLSRVIVAEMDALDAAGGDSVQVEKFAHGEFAKRRIEGFRGREAPLAKIARYLEDNARRPLVVYGESGSGKSALMARAAELAHVAHPNAAVIQRFIGAAPGASEARPLLESLCRELSHTFGDKRAIDRSYDKLFNDFRQCLALARADKPVVLFIDALDQLGDTDNGRRLDWLPPELPLHVRVVVSTLREEQYLCFPVLSARAAAQDLVELAKMSLEEGAEALDTWLENLPSPRTLTATQRSHVLERFEQSGWPLYLKLAFEEARRWHSYDRVPDSDPSRDLAHDVPGLIGALFARLERQHKIVAPHALGFLATARYGLSDDEMLALLWRDHEVKADFDDSKHHDLPDCAAALPPIVWSRLYFDLEPYLAHREVFGVGLLTFYHRQLAEVAAATCVEASNRKAEIHRQLAVHFAERWQLPDKHALLELPYHQTKEAKSGTFRSVLTELSFIEAKCTAGMTLELIDDFVMARREIGADVFAEGRRHLEEFSSFVTRHRVVLAEMPELAFQQAANEAPETTPAMAATSLWASRLERRPWLKLEYRNGSSTNAVASVRCQNRLLGATLSADGTRLAIRDGGVRVFDVQSSRELLRHSARQGRAITAAAFSSDGQQLAQAEHADGEPATCSVWCIENGARIARGQISLDLVSTIRFDAQGDLLLGGSRANGGGLVRWNRSRSTESWNQNVPGAVIAHVSEQDELVVAAQGDGVCSIWHGRDGCLLDSRSLHIGPVNAIGVSPSGTVVVSGGADHKCIVWSVGVGRERRSMFHRFARNVFGSKLGV
jgi:hypothetical protein